MADNRQHKRVSYEVQVRFIPANGSEQSGSLINISTGGAFVQAETMPGFGEKLTLFVQLPNVADESEVPCIVRWVKQGDGFGLQFEQLRPIEVWGLNKFLRAAE